MCDAESFMKHHKEFKRKHKHCDESHAILTITEKGKSYAICKGCWNKICKEDIEWDSRKVVEVRNE